MSSPRAAYGAGAKAPWSKMCSYLAPITAFYIVFLIVPYALILEMSFFSFSSTKLYIPILTLKNYVDVLTDTYYLLLIVRSIGLGILVTLICILLGFPLALKIARSGAAMKSALIALTLSPLLINLVVRSYAWIVLLGDTGLINSWLKAAGIIEAPLPLNGNTFAVVVGLVHISLPLMVLSLIGILEKIDKSLIDAAESLGASRSRILRKVVLPLSVPGIAAGSLLVFSLAISAFVTPVLLGGSRVSTISTLIYEKFTYSVNWPVGATLVMVLLVINVAVMALHGRLFKEQ
ncbi:putative spermidine/putrescine transport system permease protein [Hyphomicrobiales bacterium]|nr:putative spermidine/putrescine transport system permease protein [Hyphomicrobiales bacterium]CAH1683764.1 putative spermidine/putrescine transport system permease protein [Hyphomicrobiales bacterium]